MFTWHLVLVYILMLLYMYIAPGQGQTIPWGQMLMSTESPFLFAHMLQVSLLKTLTDDPLAPETTISCRLLSGNSFSKPAGIVTLKLFQWVHNKKVLAIKANSKGSGKPTHPHSLIAHPHSLVMHPHSLVAHLHSLVMHICTVLLRISVQSGRAYLHSLVAHICTVLSRIRSLVRAKAFAVLLTKYRELEETLDKEPEIWPC